jgi:hypothetical protein
MRSIAFSLSDHFQKLKLFVFLSPENKSLYPLNTWARTCSESFFFDFESRDSQKSSSSKVAPIFFSSGDRVCMSESWTIFHPREIELSVSTTKADLDSSIDLFRERYIRYKNIKNTPIVIDIKNICIIFAISP